MVVPPLYVLSLTTTEAAGGRADTGRGEAARSATWCRVAREPGADADEPGGYHHADRLLVIGVDGTLLNAHSPKHSSGPNVALSSPTTNRILPETTGDPFVAAMAVESHEEPRGPAVTPQRPSGPPSATPIFHSLSGSPASMNGIPRSLLRNDLKNMVAVASAQSSRLHESK